MFTCSKYTESCPKKNSHKTQKEKQKEKQSAYVKFLLDKHPSLLLWGSSHAMSFTSVWEVCRLCRQLPRYHIMPFISDTIDLEFHMLQNCTNNFALACLLLFDLYMHFQYPLTKQFVANLRKKLFCEIMLKSDVY